MKRFVFAQSALSGAASLFIRSECNINSFSCLKHAIIFEFGEQINSTEIHTVLNSRNIGDKETLYEHFLIMHAIGSISQLDMIYH